MKRRLTVLTLPLIALVAACSGDADDGTAMAEASEPLPMVEAPAGQEWATTVTKTDAGGYLMGNPDAPIKLVEFASLTCSHCADFAAEAFSTIRDDYVSTGRVSFEIRNFVRDPLDLTAAALTRCGPDTAYFALTEQTFGYQATLFEKAQAMGEDGYNRVIQLPSEQRYPALAQALGLYDFFGQRGISSDQANQCLSKVEDVEALAKRTQKATEEFNIAGTPTFLLNGRVYDFTGWPALEAQLQKMGAR